MFTNFWGDFLNKFEHSCDNLNFLSFKISKICNAVNNPSPQYEFSANII